MPRSSSTIRMVSMVADDGRKENAESRSLSQLAVSRGDAVMSPHNMIDHRQSQPGSGRLQRGIGARQAIEFFKHAAVLCLGNSGAVVADRKDDIGSAAETTYGNYLF